MAKYKVKVEQRIAYVRTERAYVVVDCDEDEEEVYDESYIGDQAIELVDEDKGTIAWSFVDEKEDDFEYESEWLEVERLAYQRPLDCPGQMKFFAT